MVDSHRCLVAESLVWPLMVVELYVVSQALPGLLRVGIFVQVDLLVFNGSLEPLCEDVVHVPSSPVHAYAYSRLFQQARVLWRGKVASLI